MTRTSLWQRLRLLLSPGNGTAAADGEARVPEGRIVYAVGDIHGEVGLLDRLLSAIGEDSARFPDLRSTVIFLGDYVDRGPSSRAVIDRLVGGPLPGDEVVTLRGNHEQAMLDFLADPLSAVDWLRFGGIETLASYGLRAPPGLTDPERITALSDELAKRLPPLHVDFLERTPLMAQVGNYAFVHAGIVPEVPLDRQRPEDLLWIRDGFVNRRFTFSHTVVHGHTITENPVVSGNRIGIDTGAYATGILTALALCGTQRRLIQARR